MTDQNDDEWVMIMPYINANDVETMVIPNSGDGGFYVDQADEHRETFSIIEVTAGKVTGVMMVDGLDNAFGVVGSRVCNKIIAGTPCNLDEMAACMSDPDNRVYRCGDYNIQLVFI
jgi:hypothetical protein